MRDPMTAGAGAPRITIRRLGPADAAHLEAHCLRLDPVVALNLYGRPADQASVRRYLAEIDFRRDIVLAGIDAQGTIRATVRIRAEYGGRWAELLPARERSFPAGEPWRKLIRDAIGAAGDQSFGWLSVASLGFDPETRAALEDAGFDLQAEEEGTIGELRLADFR